VNKKFKLNLQITLIALDLAILNLVYLICQIVFKKRIDLNYVNNYILFWTFSNFSWILTSISFKTYAIKVILSFEKFTKKAFRAYSVWIIFIMVYLYLFREYNFSRSFIFAFIGIFGLGLFINRFIYLGISKLLKNSRYLIEKVIILGYNDTAKKLAKYFEENGINIKFIGYIEDDINIHESSHYPVFSDISNTMQIVKELGVQEIFSTIMPKQNKDIFRLMNEAENECIRFKIVPDLSSFITRKVHIDYFGNLPILSPRSVVLDDMNNKIMKRAFDIIISFFVIIFVLSWLIPLLGLLIYLESKGPVFFKQWRMGKNNEPFCCLKFRSMKLNKDSDVKQATRMDPRLTRVGKFIRKTSLDEFPQFINVFKGEMSLVGPRPHPANLNNKYKPTIDELTIRQFMKPGITGWAQINGYRGETKDIEMMAKRVEYDLLYMEGWTFWLDIKIIFLTVYFMIIGDKNAY
jgi:putative colanic acid biosynthesis UDP-glucose lipid carrier transferase